MSKSQKQVQNTTQSQQGSQTSTSSVGETPDIAAARGFEFKPSPRLPFMYGQARQKLASSFNNPIGGNYTPNMRDAIQRSGNRDLLQQESQAEGEANADLQGQKYGQKVTLAAMTAPRTSTGTYQGTGTGSGTSVTSQSMIPDLIGAAVGGAAA